MKGKDDIQIILDMVIKHIESNNLDINSKLDDDLRQEILKKLDELE